MINLSHIANINFFDLPNIFLLIFNTDKFQFIHYTNVCIIYFLNGFSDKIK